jgi:hypothetical protein
VRRIERRVEITHSLCMTLGGRLLDGDTGKVED